VSDLTSFGGFIILLVDFTAQVVFPHLSEPYSSSSDPVDDAVPLCTLKSFPYQADHTVSWAKSLFEILFGSDVTMLQSALRYTKASDGSVAAYLNSLSGEEHARLLAMLPRGGGFSSADAVDWALRLFDSLFNEEVRTLIDTHPRDELDDTGAPFWSGSRKFPSTQLFDKGSQEHVSFVRWAAALRCVAVGAAAEGLETELLRRIESFTTIEAMPVPSSDEQHGLLLDSLESLRAQLSHGGLAALEQGLRPVVFEKDDAALGHVHFLTAAAHIRCRIYGIRPVDALEVKRIAGNIIPALATTTAMVAGLVCLELVKAIRILETDLSPNRAIELLRNSFVNLALPIMSFAQPVPPETFHLETPGARQTFTVWDSLPAPDSVDILTVASLADHLQEKFGVWLESVSLADHLLYADFMGDEAQHVQLTVKELVGLTATTTMPDEDDRAGEVAPLRLPERGFVDLEVSCVDEQGRDVRTPPVRVSCTPSTLSDTAPPKLGKRARAKALFTKFLKRVSS
jgi:ubiquitin-activating enzyme E1